MSVYTQYLCIHRYTVLRCVWKSHTIHNRLYHVFNTYFPLKCRSISSRNQKENEEKLSSFFIFLSDTHDKEVVYHYMVWGDTCKNFLFLSIHIYKKKNKKNILNKIKLLYFPFSDIFLILYYNMLSFMVSIHIIYMKMYCTSYV